MPDSSRNQNLASNGNSTEDGSYVVVARRYRPRGFAELVGQEHVGRALKNAIETNRVGHAYLFTGARGVGKTSTARIFAKALNDPQGPTAQPDPDSDVAQAIDAGEDVDVIEIDGASNRGIDEIRSLRANVGVRPSRSRYKIYIIDEVHMLTAPAFNALLKTLEEPPDHVKFIFCTTDPEKIPITVLSRCQRFDFAPVEVAKIVQRLSEIVEAESAEAEEAALELIARRAAGSMRDSQSLLEQVLSFSDGKLTVDQVHSMLGTADDQRLHALAQAMASRDAAEAMKKLDSAIESGVDAGRLAEQLLGYFRDLMAATVGCDANLMRHTSLALHTELKQLGDRWGLQTVLAVVALLDQTLVRIRHSVHGRVLLEAALIQICNLPDLQHLADLAAATSSDPTAGSQKKKLGERRPSSSLRPASDLQTASADSSRHDVGSDSRATQIRIDRDEQTVRRREPVGVAAPHKSVAAAVTRDDSRSAASASGHPNAAPAEQMAPASRNAVGPKRSEASAVDQGGTEGEQPAGLPQRTAAEAWTKATAEKIWPLVLSELESMTETFARVVERLEVPAPGRLRLVFPADAALARRRCELPEHSGTLAAAISRLAGQTIRLEFESATAPAARTEPKPVGPPKLSRQQQMKEIETNDLVRSCLEVFDAEIVRIEIPR